MFTPHNRERGTHFERFISAQFRCILDADFGLEWLKSGIGAADTEFPGIMPNFLLDSRKKLLTSGNYGMYIHFAMSKLA
jgi:hypothetical protein